MDKELFATPGLETFYISDEKTGWQWIVFRSLSEKFITTLKWNPLKLPDDSHSGKHIPKKSKRCFTTE